MKTNTTKLTDRIVHGFIALASILTLTFALQQIFVKQSHATTTPESTCTISTRTGELKTGVVGADGVCNAGQAEPITDTGKVCGDPTKNPVIVGIDFGCKRKGNAILDMTFAILRFLTIGVGIVVIGSIVLAGIQYTVSRGDPNATSQALKRVSSSVGALILFIFIYAILNWIVPNTILQ